MYINQYYTILYILENYYLSYLYNLSLKNDTFILSVENQIYILLQDIISIMKYKYNQINHIHTGIISFDYLISLKELSSIIKKYCKKTKLFPFSNSLNKLLSSINWKRDNKLDVILDKFILEDIFITNFTQLDILVKNQSLTVVKNNYFFCQK